MRLKVIIVVVFLFVCILNENSVNALSRIVGGFICNVTEHPFVVSVHSSVSCGGSLISTLWVLTAGHCIHQDSVKAGKTIIRAGYNAPAHYIQKRKAKLAVVHNKFDLDKMEHQVPQELRYDIALILVEGSFRQSVVLKPVALPKAGFTETCTIGRAIGTGSEVMQHSLRINRTRFARGFMNRPLKCVDLHLTTSDICAKTYPGSVVDDTIVCTLEKQYGQDACQGDSGGPLVCYKEKSDEAVLIGIVSAGHGCGIANRSATFTKVESYLDFINQTIAKKSTASLFFIRQSWRVLSMVIFLDIVLVL